MIMGKKSARKPFQAIRRLCGIQPSSTVGHRFIHCYVPVQLSDVHLVAFVRVGQSDANYCEVVSATARTPSILLHSERLVADSFRIELQ